MAGTSPAMEGVTWVMQADALLLWRQRLWVDHHFLNSWQQFVAHHIHGEARGFWLWVQRYFAWWVWLRVKSKASTSGQIGKQKDENEAFHLYLLLQGFS